MNMMMHNPPYPGSILREDILAENGISVTEAAARLGISRVALSRVLNGHAAISADLALRLEEAGLGRAGFWLDMQAYYDLARLRQAERPKVRSLADLTTA